MKKFTKKAIEVQAIQYDGMPESLEELTALGLQYRLGEDSSITIVTNHGEVSGEIGDYIMMSVTGEFDICSQDKFEKLYSAQEDTEDKNNEINEAEKENSNKNDLYESRGYTTPVEWHERWERWNKERIQKYYAIIAAAIIFLFMSSMLPYFYDHIVKKTIKTTVQFIEKEEIERESNLLLENTKLEAQSIIDQAKEEAKKEADESFRKEMERLTNERVRK